MTGHELLSAETAAFVALGTNQGDRHATIESAFAALAALPRGRLVARSPVYVTAPHDAAGPDYLNAVAELRTALEPHALLGALQRIEADHGRERPYRNAPRTLDLDLLLYGDACTDSPTLTLPHPRMHERAFVLRPLADIAPALQVPGRGAVADLLHGVAAQRVLRWNASGAGGAAHVDGGATNTATGSAGPNAGIARFRHIAIEGPIGVGKSSLAARLARQLGAELMREQPDDNPFLGRFYADMAGYAFQTQLFFLFQRLKQVRAAAQPGMFAPALVSDFLFAKDAIFARLNLNDDEYRLYAQMYAQVAPQVSEPDLVIWLQASPATLMQRIRRRAIPMEQGIEEAYLQRLCDAYVEYFQGYAGAPVLAVGTEQFNPVERDADFTRLVERLDIFQGRREFFDSHVELGLS